MTIFLSCCSNDNDFRHVVLRSDNFFALTAFRSFSNVCFLVRVVFLKEKKDAHVLDENCMVSYEQLFEAFFSLQCRAGEVLLTP